MPSRDNPEMTPCDHCILKFLHPLPMQEVSNKLGCSQIQQLLTLFRGVLDQKEIVILTKEQISLLFEKKELFAFSTTNLESLGLTRREAEVLFWVAKDKSNVEIAKVLDCCEGTVRKHLEHLYKKLGVQTRMGAVMKALERLSLLQA